jgi:chromosome transmission fidelity protein 18
MARVFFDDDNEDADRPRTFLLQSVRATSFHGRHLTIPAYDSLPPYFNRPLHFDVTWIENPPPPDIPLDSISDIPLVDKYVAHTYSELVSDEIANRTVLDWMRYFQQSKLTSGRKKKRSRAKRPEEAGTATDPVVTRSNILLLSGPPGSGKSTLIRVAAARCGFHVIELNASEDARAERNQILLQGQLDFEPVFGARTRPLLVLEEMDGIGTISDSITRAISELKGRPIVVAVNDAYVPALRTIRTQAQVVRMPPPPVSKFIARLKRICENEHINITPQALADLAEASHLDMRTALNTLQFVAIRQPVTAEMLQLTPVGVKNSALTPFDVWTALFSQATKLEDTLRTLESFGDVRLVAVGVLENLEAFRSPDPTGHRIADLLDGLCFADCAVGELAGLGLAGVPKLHGVAKVGVRQITFPSNTLARESQIRRNQQVIANNPKWREYRDLFDFYVSPSQQVAHMLTGRTGSELRKRFVDFHRMVKVTYKKNDFGHYIAEPDVDMIIGFEPGAPARLAKFREFIQHEIEKLQSAAKVTKERDLSQKLTRVMKKKKAAPATDFWGQKIEQQLSQYTQDRRAPIVYKYNEGFTNAVRRPVYLSRILLA